MRRSISLAVIASLAGLLHGSAAAQTQGETPRREGDYQGVVPGQSERSPAKTRRPRITWVGFQPLEGGGSRFFVQLNQSVEVQQWLDGDQALHVLIPRGVLGSRNVRRPVVTRFFNTSVAQLHPRRVGRSRGRKGQPVHPSGVRLDIRFKTPADARQAQVSVRKEDDGYHYLYLSFPPASEQPQAPERADSGPRVGEDDVAP